MKLKVFGATGGTGQEVVRQALERGHDVEAVVRDPAKLPLRNPRLTVTVADIGSPESLLPVVADADAVLSALGPRKGGPATITADGVRVITQAMKAQGARRIVTISAAPVPPAPATDKFIYKQVLRPMLWRFYGETYRALADMERVLAESGLDWTVMRPPYLTNGPHDEKFRTSTADDARSTGSMSRANLADAMLRVLDEPETIGKYVAISKK